MYCFSFSELESKIEDELEKMRAKLGGRYAKYAKPSRSTDSPFSKANIINPDDVRGSKSISKQERTINPDEGIIRNLYQKAGELTTYLPDRYIPLHNLN